MDHDQKKSENSTDAKASLASEIEAYRKARSSGPEALREEAVKRGFEAKNKTATEAFTARCAAAYKAWNEAYSLYTDANKAYEKEIAAARAAYEKEIAAAHAAYEKAIV